MKEIQDLLELKKRHILELKTFLDLHSENFPPLNRNSPPDVKSGSSLSQVEKEERDVARETFQLLLGDISQEIDTLVSQVNNVKYVESEKLDKVLLLQDFLNEDQLKEVDNCITDSSAFSPALTAVKKIKSLTGLGLKESKTLYENYFNTVFRGRAKGQKYGF